MDWENPQLIRTLAEHSGPVATVAFSPDSEVVVIGSCDSAVKLWQVATGDRALTLFGYPLGVNCVAMNPRSPLMAVGVPDGTIDLWQLPEGKRLHQFTGEGRITAVGFSPDGQMLICGSDRSFVDTMFASRSSKSVQSLENTEGGTIKIWRVRDGHLRKSISVPNPIHALDVSLLTKTFASGHRDGTLQLWHLPNGTQTAMFNAHDDAVYSVAISPDGETLASGSGDGTIKLWQIVKDTHLQPTPLQNLTSHTDVVYSVAISPDGQTLASGSGDGTIKLWHLKTGTLLTTLKSDSPVPPAAIAVAFSSDSQLLVSGSGDGGAKIWQAKSPTP